MIPPFDDDGLLPPGIHPATLPEIAERFGTGSEVRRAQGESIKWLVALAATAGVSRIVLNGSFTTDTLEPNDVDCLLMIGAGFPENRDAERELLDGLPFLDISFVDTEEFEWFTKRFFAHGRDLEPKGMIEVIGWK